MQPPSATRGATWHELTFATCGFVLLTCALTYPQILHMSSHVGEHYDALFSIWRLAWIAHQLVRDPARLFDANIFHPEPNTLAYSDALLLPGLLGAPLIWAGVSPVLVHNLLILLSFVSCGVAMYGLIRALNGSPAAAMVSGLIFAFQPYRFAHYAQLELLWTCWIPLAFWALHHLIATGRVRAGVALGLAVSFQAWSCLYYAVFLVTALAVLAFVLLIGRPRQELTRLVAPSVASCVVALILCGAYAIPYVQSRGAVGARTDEDVRTWSPTLDNYLATTAESWFYVRTPQTVGPIEGVLFPGFTAIGLAGIAFVAAPRRRTLAYGTLLVVAFDLSLGPNGFLYMVVRSVVWPYQGLRVPARMFVIVCAGLAVLAAFGLSWLLGRMTPWLRRVTAAALACAVVLEGLATPLPLSRIPEPPRVYAWLAEQPPTAIMEWPLHRPDNLGHTQEPLYMYLSTFHWHRLVNGYSGFYPRRYLDFLHLVPTFPDDESIGALRRRSVRYVIVHSEFGPVQYLEVLQRLSANSDVEFMFRERVPGGEISVFRIRDA